LKDTARAALAWHSIVDDVKEGKLNIDILQQRQAQKEMESADQVVPKAARECYKWLLCPVLQSPTDSTPEIEAFILNTTGGSAGNEIERVCQDNELVITTWSPVHLVAQLRELYWKGDRKAVGALTFWEDTQKYLYLPRLKNRDTLAQAIRTGAGSRDFFGFAYGQADGVYQGFGLGSGSVQVDDTLLLIELNDAKRYEESLKKPGPVILPQVGGPGVGETVGSDGGGEVFVGPAAGTGSDGRVVPVLPPPPQRLARHFHGSVKIKPDSARLRLEEIADEVIRLLTSDPNARLEITLEISAEFEQGVPEHIKRGVTENANTLKFNSASWE